MLVDFLARINSDAKIPLYDGSFFFPALEELFQIINLSGGLKHLYEKSRPAGTPTWKTLYKLSSSDGKKAHLRPTTITKLERLFAGYPDRVLLMERVATKDASWPQYTQWIALIDSELLSQSATRVYWRRQLDAAWELWCKKIREVKCPIEKARIIAENPLSKELGCELTKVRLIKLIESKPSAEELLNSPIFRNHMIASLVTTILRFAAWLVADWIERYWENIVRLGDQDKMFLRFLLPHFNQETSSFSCPVETCIKHMAKITYCPEDKSPSSHLGQLWADFEFEQNIDMGSLNTVQSKQRLIRLWLEGNKGRPDAKSVFSLSKAIAHKVTGEASFNPREQDPSMFFLGCGFIFSESCRHIMKDLIKAHLQTDELVAIFSTYVDEYRKARSTFGKPLSGGNDTPQAESGCL
jgi:hypothetical protein